MNTDNATRLFESLSAATRLDIFRLLVRMGHAGMVAGEIAATLQIAPSRLSFHLKALTHAGMVSVTPEGRFLRYRANLALMLELIAYLTEACCSEQPEHCARQRAQSRCSPAVLPALSAGIGQDHGMEQQIRPATASDWDAIAALLQDCHLPLAGARAHLDHFLLAESQNQLLGVAGLEPQGQAALLRSVATAAGARGRGIAALLIERLLQQARAQGIDTLVLLTTSAADYFARFGFARIAREEAPPALRETAEFCGACPASAVVMRLTLQREPARCTGAADA